MQQNSLRIDLALVDGKKGVLKLTVNRLEYTSRKGVSFSVEMSEINDLNFRKTALTTSTLIVNGMEITVCRAHLWAADIERLRASNGKNGTDGRGVQYERKIKDSR